MVAPAAGAVVLVKFPFSDLSRSKLRPAVVLAEVGRGDHVLCQVTSKPYGDSAAVTLNQTDFASGSLEVTSYVRRGKLFTASKDLITTEVGTLKPEALARVVDAVVACCDQHPRHQRNRRPYQSAPSLRRSILRERAGRVKGSLARSPLQDMHVAPLTRPARSR